VAAHYTAHIGLATSFYWSDCRLLRNPEVSLSQICFIAPCNCYTFCPISLAPYLCFNILFQHFLKFTLS